MRRILILGGTAGARQLAGRLAGRANLDVILSLAGRTAQPAAQPVGVRIGGFGGADGLADYLQSHGIEALVDATHPYAAIISAHAADAARRAGVPMLALRRAAWTAQPEDRWIEVADADEAARALPAEPHRVFLTIGRKEVAAFAQAPQHDYLVRSVDPVDPPLAVPRAHYIVARGPFSERDERDVLAKHGIQFVVAKNSGGDATYGKIAAARALGIPVVMLRRPALPDAASTDSIDEAVRWLDHAPGS